MRACVVVLVLAFLGLPAASRAGTVDARSEGTSSAPAAGTLAPSLFTPLASPLRAYDSGPGGVGTTPVRVALPAGIPAGATAVVLNLTGDRPSAATNVAAYPADLSTPPAISALNLLAGSTSADLVTVPLPSTAGDAIELHNAVGTIRLIVDLAGYYSASAGVPYVPVVPFRAYDSRSVDSGGRPLTSTPQSLSAAALRVPADATAVVVNVTAVAPSVKTDLVVWPAGTSAPSASDLNVAAGDTRANLATVALGGSGAGISLRSAAGSTQFLVDVQGWYSPTATGTLYTPLSTPERVFGQSSRPALGAGRTFDLAMPSTVPSTASAAAFTLTIAHASAKTDAAAYPPGPAPSTSNVNVDAGIATPNLVVSGLAASTTAVAPNAGSLTGSIDTPTAVRLMNVAGSVEVIVDLQGFFVPNPRGDDVSDAQCSGSGSGTAAPLPTGAAFGIVNPTAGDLAFSGTNPCLSAEDAWAAGTPGGEGFYLALSDKGPSSSNWPNGATAPDPCAAGANSAGCAYDFGYDQAQDVYGDAASTGHAAAAVWWLDVETSAPWQASASQNAEVVDGALAYLATAGVTVGLYSTASQWSSLVGALTDPAVPEWYAQAGLSAAQLATYCTASFAGGAVSMVQDGGSADGSVLDSDLRC